MKIKLLLIGTMLVVPIAGHAACTMTQADCNSQYFDDCGNYNTAAAVCVYYELNTTTCMCENKGNSYYTCNGGYYGTRMQFGTPSCTICPAGTYSYRGDTSCTPCPAGTYSTAGTEYRCTPCPKGTYNPNKNSTSSSACIACESGGTTSGTGATSKSECCLTSNSFSDSTGSGTYTDACCQS